MQLRLALLASAVATAVSCSPSAQIRKASPVANLKTYRKAMIRVDGSGPGKQYSGSLQMAVAQRLRTSCSFTHVLSGKNAKASEADLIVDLNIQRAFRGGTGLVQNPNLAVVDVTMVLSDGVDDALLGSVEIRGKSSGVVTGSTVPEEQALGVVADSIANVLSISGCTGARVARATPPPKPAKPKPKPGEEPAETEPGGVAPEVLAKANAENDQGKASFRSADIPGAKGHFEAAIALFNDPKFVLNLCLAHEALGELDQAEAACKSIVNDKAEPHLVEKANLRLEIIAGKKADG